MASNSPKHTTEQEMRQQLQRIEAKLDRLLAALPAAGGPTAPLGQPTLCGYPCSWDLNEAGWPLYIITPDGEKATKKVGVGGADHWYSVTIDWDNRKFGPKFCFFSKRHVSPPDGSLVMPAASQQPHSGAQPPQERRNGHKPPQTPQKPPKADPAPQERRNGHHPPASQGPEIATGAQFSRIDQLGQQVYGQEWPDRSRRHLEKYRAECGLQTYSSHSADIFIQRLEAMAAERKPAPPERKARAQVGFLPNAQAVLTRAQAVMQMNGGSHNAS